MRTNEEFRAEVYRRRQEALKKRSARTKHIINALVCLPLGTMVAFVGLSLAIAMQPAGSADKNEEASTPGSSAGTGDGSRYVYVEDGDVYKEALLAFFAEIEKRTPEAYAFDAESEAVSYKIYACGKFYFVCESYIRVNGECFKITEDEFAEFLNIIGE